MNERCLYYRRKTVGCRVRESGFPWHFTTIANVQQVCGTGTVLLGRGYTTSWMRAIEIVFRSPATGPRPSKPFPNRSTV